ncbi:putative transcription factor WD40-like family [Helianthus anomalus]
MSQDVISCCAQHDSSFFYHRCIATIEGHSSYISSLAIGGQFLYTGSSDNEIRLI